MNKVIQEISQEWVAHHENRTTEWCRAEDVRILKIERNKLREALKYTLDRLREYNVFIPEYLKLTRIDKEGE